MRAVVTRVTRAVVRIDGDPVGEVGRGLLVLVGVTHEDTIATADALARKVFSLRVLPGESSLADLDAPSALVVSQFTLYGDTRKGRRPTWLAAAAGAVAEPLVERVVDTLRGLGCTVETGRFGADMQVESVNDGPMTLLIEI